MNQKLLYKHYQAILKTLLNNPPESQDVRFYKSDSYIWFVTPRYAFSVLETESYLNTSMLKSVDLKPVFNGQGDMKLAEPTNQILQTRKGLLKRFNLGECDFTLLEAKLVDFFPTEQYSYYTSGVNSPVFCKLKYQKRNSYEGIILPVTVRRKDRKT